MKNEDREEVTKKDVEGGLRVLFKLCIAIIFVVNLFGVAVNSHFILMVFAIYAGYSLGTYVTSLE